jgi:sugar phosphate isomerase/epimerase
LPDGRTILDALFEETAPDNQQFLFDVLFSFYSGFDPCAYLERFAGRVPQIHFNDLDPAGRTATGSGADCMNLSTELGKGCMNLPAIYRTAVKTGVRWVILEQHILRDNPLESARHNFEHYQKIIASQT